MLSPVVFRAGVIISHLNSCFEKNGFNMRTAISRRTTINMVCAACFVLFMLFYPVSIEIQLLERMPAEGFCSASQQNSFSFTPETISQYMEIAQEASGVTSTDVNHNAVKVTRTTLHSVIQFQLATLYISPRSTFPSGRHFFFLFQNNFIHSRSIILRFIERQDGSKSH